MSGWKLLAAVLVGWAALAWTQRSACGCGAEHSPEQALADALSGLGQLLSGAKSARSVQQSFGQSMERLQQSCGSRLSSAVCHISCWMAGKELQRSIWWSCFRRGGHGLPEQPGGGGAEGRGTGGPTSWPGLVGEKVGHAVRRISSERPDVSVRVMREGDMATMDFDEARVRVYADESDTVTRAPIIG